MSAAVSANRGTFDGAPWVNRGTFDGPPPWVGGRTRAGDVCVAGMAGVVGVEHLRTCLGRAGGMGGRYLIAERVMCIEGAAA